MIPVLLTVILFATDLISDWYVAPRTTKLFRVHQFRQNSSRYHWSVVQADGTLRHRKMRRLLQDDCQCFIGED